LTLTTSLNLLPHMLNTTRSALMILALLYLCFNSALFCQVAASAS
jgi:hypothetical protein